MFSKIHGEDEMGDQSHQQGFLIFVFHQTLLLQPKILNRINYQQGLSFYRCLSTNFPRASQQRIEHIINNFSNLNYNVSYQEIYKCTSRILTHPIGLAAESRFQNVNLK